MHAGFEAGGRTAPQAVVMEVVVDEESLMNAELRCGSRLHVKRVFAVCRRVEVAAEAHSIAGDIQLGHRTSSCRDGDKSSEVRKPWPRSLIDCMIECSGDRMINTNSRNERLVVGPDCVVKGASHPEDVGLELLL